METANKHVPMRQVKKYKPFLNEELKKLMEKRNKAHREAKTLQTPEALETLKKAILDFKTKLKESKRDTLHQYINNIDYKKDGTKAHTFFFLN
jgi:predicted component of type VI protein secretion system